MIIPVLLSACGDDAGKSPQDAIIITDFVTTSGVIDQGRDALFAVRAYSTKGLPLQYRYRLLEGGGSLSQSTNATVVFSPASEGGSLTLQVEVSDTENNTNIMVKRFYVRKQWKLLRDPADGNNERFQNVAIARDGSLYVGWQKWQDNSSTYFRGHLYRFDPPSLTAIGIYGARCFHMDLVAGDNYPYFVALSRGSQIDTGAIFVRYYNGSGTEYLYNTPITPYGYSRENRPTLALAPDGTLYLACLYGTSSSDREYLSVFRYQADVTNWVRIGTNVSEGDMPRNVSMVVGTNGYPVIAYEQSDGKTYTKRYNGTTWQRMMITSVGAGVAMRPKLVLGPDGKMYIVYIDGPRGNRLSIKYFNGIHWEYLGEPGFTEGRADWPTLLFDSNGIPFVVFQNGAYMGCVSVMYYTGSGWEYTAAPAGSDYGASYIDADIGPDDTIYIAYRALGGTYGTGVLSLR